MSSAFQGTSATKEQVAELFAILSIMRPHLSGMEAKFINTFLKPLKPEVDACGNMIVRIGKAPVMWSCHVDTVHNHGGIAPIKLHDDGLIKLHPKSRANCLGADDGTGVWLMLQMIRAQRPGMYVFHRGEERGGVGSRWIAKNTPKLLDGIEAAIAFDRKDKGSIITHQWGGRCCSEDFSKSLAKSIGLGMKSDSTGSFTDTASYTELVGECTNVSVGYKWQHGRTEEQDLPFALVLLDRMLEVNVEDLVYKRKPGEKEKTKWSGGGRRTYGGAGAWDSGYPDYYGHGGGSSHYYSPKLKFETGKIWDCTERGYVWPHSSGKVWDDKKEMWITKPTVETIEPAKNARTYMDTNNRWKIGREVEVKSEGVTKGAGVILVEETYQDVVKDFPEEIAAMLAEKQYGLGYLHEQVRKHGGKVTTRYLPREEEKTHDKSKDRTTCSDCYRLPQYCICKD